MNEFEASLKNIENAPVIRWFNKYFLGELSNPSVLRHELTRRYSEAPYSANAIVAAVLEEGIINRVGDMDIERVKALLLDLDTKHNVLSDLKNNGCEHGVKPAGDCNIHDCVSRQTYETFIDFTART